MPASMTTWRPPRSRTCRTRATSQPDRATSARPGSMARRAGRRPSGTLARRSGSSRANRSGAGTGSSSGRTGKPPPTSSVSNVSRLPRRRPTTASPRRTASRQASTARSCEPTWRWTPRGRIAPSACVASHSTRPVASVSVMPNLDAPSPTASPAIVSGVTSGLSRTSTSSGGRPRRPRPARRAIAVSTSPSSADSRATHSSGFAPARGRADRGAEVGIGLAHALQGDPVVGDARPAGDGPLAARHDVGAEPARGHLGHDRGDVVGLDRVLPDPRVGERRPHGRCRPVQLREVGHIGRRAVPVGDVAESGRDRVRNGRGDGVLSRGRQAGLPC